ncbi:MAG: hypothetical protein K1X64_11425 [Myxococcaceae bacterium]|nr:hypothetical protein [Myxococcaceae bacterium]
MIDSNVKPLPRDIADLLQSAPRPEMPAGFEAKLLTRIQASLEVPVPTRRGEASSASASPGAETSAALSKMGSWGIPISIAALTVGVGSGILVGRATAPEPVPVIAEATPPPVSPARPETPPPPAADPQEQREPVKSEPPSRKTETKRQADMAGSTRDVSLADERALIEIARTALAKRQTGKALETLQAHAEKFSTGQLVEERESLWVQALVNAGEKAQALKKAEAFRQRFPDSMLLPAVDAALTAP